MTTRFKGFTVALDHELRDDDAEVVISAIRQLKGVISVVPVVATAEDGIVESRIKHQLVMKLLDVLK